MKALNETQVKVINDFIEFKNKMRKKYSNIRTGMVILERVYADILKEYDGNKPPSAISMTALIENDLSTSPIANLQVDKNNMLLIGMSKEVVEDKEEVIEACINFISDISFHIAEFKKNEDDDMFYIDIGCCKEHIKKIINVIYEISKE